MEDFGRGGGYTIVGKLPPFLTLKSRAKILSIVYHSILLCCSSAKESWYKKALCLPQLPQLPTMLGKDYRTQPTASRAWQRLVPWYQSVDSILLLSYSQKHILLLLQYKKTDTSITRKIWNCYGDQCRLASWTENEWSVTTCE